MTVSGKTGIIFGNDVLSVIFLIRFDGKVADTDEWEWRNTRNSVLGPILQHLSNQ